MIAFGRRVLKFIYSILMHDLLYPEGFIYKEEFLSAQDETALLQFAESLTFEPYVMRGQASKRGIARFGFGYGAIPGAESVPREIPAELIELRDAVARQAAIDPEGIRSALVTKYPPGAGIGWHRDFSTFGPTVIGVSMLAACSFKLRAVDNKTRVFTLRLQPRSIYIMSGKARSEWEHSIPAVGELRYSVTFRTLRKATKADGAKGR